MLDQIESFADSCGASGDRSRDCELNADLAPGEICPLMTKVFVTGLRVWADVGIYEHESGKLQPLVSDVELDLPPITVGDLSDTLNYETIRSAALAIAEQGHIDLVETFAERLARACMSDHRVARARVRVAKPLALAPDASSAGVELTLERKPRAEA